MFKLYLISLFLYFSQTVLSIQLSVDECLRMGFRKSELSCLRCEELIKFDLFSLKDSCLKCCQKESNEDSTKKYYWARLEMCGCATHAATFPQTNAFIKSDKIKKFPNLTVKTVKGSDPVIKLMDANKVVIEELNIEKWDTDTIDEFLSASLVKPNT